MKTVVSFRVAFVAATIACLSAFAPDQGRAAAFMASTGDSVELTPIGRMNCGALSRKLREIDATGYRGARPRPVDDSDRKLFRYELRVSKKFYANCGNYGVDPSKRRCVFLRGFKKKNAVDNTPARCRGDGRK